MLQAIFKIVVLVYYLSILLELYGLAVPSPASTYQIVQKQKANRFLIGIWSAIALLAFILPLISMVLSFFKIPFMQISNNELVLIFSMILIVIGRTFTLWGTLNIREHLQKSNFSILATGIFAISRHPIATGLIISLFGFNLAFLDVFLAVLSILFITNMHYKVLIEERLLLRENKQGYAKYKKQTPRYL